MNWIWMGSVATALGVVLLSAADSDAGQDKSAPLAGWLGAFPEIPNYQRTFLEPVVAKDKPPTAYRQAARYEWTGGRLEIIEATLARDPAFKEKHAAGALRKQSPAPKEVKVGKRTAWLWEPNKILVILGEDKALILERKGGGEEMVKMAGHFDLDRLEKALAGPPRTDFKRTPGAFRDLKKGMSYFEVASWVGFPEKDAGKQGAHVLVYQLPDGARALLGFADLSKLDYAKLEGQNGKMEDLIK